MTTPALEIEVVAVPPMASVLPERLVVEALPVEREPAVSALVTVRVEKVGVEAVVRCWPVLKASCVSPTPSAVTPKSSPVQVRAVPTTSEQSKMRSPLERSRPSPTNSSKVSPPKVKLVPEMVRLEEKRALPVVVAPPETVRPVMAVPPPIVEEA